MGASIRVLFFLVCWLNMLTSLCFAEKAQTWSGHVEEETFLATEVEGHELDRMVYAERQRTEPGPAVDHS